MTRVTSQTLYKVGKGTNENMSRHMTAENSLGVTMQRWCGPGSLLQTRAVATVKARPSTVDNTTGYTIHHRSTKYKREKKNEI